MQVQAAIPYDDNYAPRPRQMDANSQTAFSNAFSWMQMFALRLNFHWSLFQRVQLNIPAMVQIMAWRRPGDKWLSEPMMVSLPTHICIARLQWVNTGLVSPILIVIYLGIMWTTRSNNFLITKIYELVEIAPSVFQTLSTKPDLYLVVWSPLADSIDKRFNHLVFVKLNLIIYLHTVKSYYWFSLAKGKLKFAKFTIIFVTISVFIWDWDMNK